MSDLQSELAALSQLVDDSRTNIYAQLASLAIVWYDYSLTLSDEISLVWRKSWSISKVLFFLNRYSGLFSLTFNTSVYINNTLSDNFCFHWVRYQVGSSIIAFWLVDLILAVRVWALWGRSKRVLAFLCLLFTLSIGSSSAVAAEVFRFITVLHRPGPFAPGCYPMGFPTYTYAIAVPEITNSGILLAMTLYRTVSTVRHGRGNAPLLMLFIKDGVLYYLCIIFIILMNAFAFSSFAITAAASGLAVAIPCVFGSRILLNIRKQLKKSDQLNAFSMPTLATMNFGEGLTATARGEATTRSRHADTQGTSTVTTRDEAQDTVEDDDRGRQVGTITEHFADRPSTTTHRRSRSLKMGEMDDGFAVSDANLQ